MQHWWPPLKKDDKDLRIVFERLTRLITEMCGLASKERLDRTGV